MCSKLSALHGRADKVASQHSLYAPHRAEEDELLTSMYHQYVDLSHGPDWLRLFLFDTMSSYVTSRPQLTLACSLQASKHLLFSADIDPTRLRCSEEKLWMLRSPPPQDHP